LLMHRSHPKPRQLTLPFLAVSLRRLEPGRNVARFYALAVERDLFGRVVVVRQWGRIGTAGRTRLDEHPDEGRAVAAMTKLEASKRRRGYALTGLR
jgi:predicted DNA-binding WGR domain protein